MRIIIGSDHGGFDLKEVCRHFLEEKGEYELKDIGVFSNDSSDYPAIAHGVAQGVSRGEFERGLLICGTGIGMSITANRYKGVRAALCHDLYTARLCRQHNDANILVMGGRVTGPGLALEMLDLFLKTRFEGGRHKRRIDQIEV
ncbi:MAG: ribose 5-phosphate isomerase B [Deltaproteobacteria bacterium]|nr:ribose 5-phosphate isomerase B [Deltaproteobacteria bacterium]MBW2017151.1 ribose 5-phosphate isomerase B [Deltaproteobacteria bacterium]MBW2127929.1 ribose 5-phosphate isomerase B [Deltaproteobacteria bacterium]MBW2304466.1 ribose 5-phosphate isomerase B [Deltaproteobacteria bacterium]